MTILVSRVSLVVTGKNLMADISTIYYYGQFSKPGDCENWIANALNRNGYYCYRIDKDLVSFKDFRLKALREKPDACLFTKIPEVPVNEFVDFSRSYKAQTEGLVLWWTFDWMNHPIHHDWYWPMAKESDMCFQTDGYGDEKKYREWGINRYELHQAADIQHGIPKIITHEDVEKFSADISFAGSVYTERRKEINSRLYRKYDGYKYYGNQSLRSGGGQEIWGQDFAKMCFLSKIVIGDNFTNDVAGYWSDRVYLTLGCGGFFLTSYVEGLEKKFGDYYHLAWYKDLNEMEELIDYFLPREGLRKTIAKNGYEFVRQNHTYDNRIQEFTEVIKEYQNEK